MQNYIFKKATFSEEKFQFALQLACSFFPVKDLFDNLHVKQILALRKFFAGNDIFFSAPTGFGKSIIYELIPIMADTLNDRVAGSSVIIVISLLKALIEDQVAYLNTHTAVTAINLTDVSNDKETLCLISDESYSIVYSSPETFLSIKCWQELASSSDFRDRCVALVIGEAHCLIQW